MKPRTFFETKCAKHADMGCQRHMQIITTWRQQHAKGLFLGAVKEAVPDMNDLTEGEKTLIEALEAKFGLMIAADKKFEEMVHREMHSLMASALNDTGMKDIFGFIEDHANEKSSAMGEEGLARSKRLYAEYYSERKANEEA